MIQKVFGYLLIASPFIALFILMWRYSGIEIALSVYGIATLILVIIGIGIYLVL